jgi:hypothetical protein
MTATMTARTLPIRIAPVIAGMTLSRYNGIAVDVDQTRNVVTGDFPRDLLMAIEQRLVLGDKHRRMLAEELSDYLFIRSTGHIGSLTDLLRRGCARAIRTGTGFLTQKLLHTIRIDSAAEQARRALAGAFRTQKKTTKLQLQ